MPAKARERSDRPGTWEVVVHVGKRVSKRTIGRGEEARLRALEEADRINAEAGAASAFLARPPDHPLPIDAVLREWLVAYKHTFSYSYEQLARGLVENHIVPHFGSRDLRSLVEQDVIAFGSKLMEKGLSPGVFGSAGSILRRVIGLHAARYGIEANPFSNIGQYVRRFEKRYSRGGQRRDSWTLEELGKILDLAERHERWLYPALVFSAYTGARKSEAIGLKWDSVDFASGFVLIRDAQVRNRPGLPKDSDERRVPMDVGGSRLREVLLELARTRRTREAWKGPDYVFRSARGGAIEERNFHRAYERLRGHFPEHAIRPLVFHCFRHTFVSLALRAGWTLREVGAWVGHSDERMTQLYGHLVPSNAARGFLEERPALRALVEPIR